MPFDRITVQLALVQILEKGNLNGLRRSEVMGLKWDSVDFFTGTLTIRHTVVQVETLVEKDKTKNVSSRRSFPLLPEIAELLQGLKKQETENRKFFKKEYNENNYIFKWDDGRPFTPDYVTQRFSRLLEIHKMPQTSVFTSSGIAAQLLDQCGLYAQGRAGMAWTLGH